MFSKNRNETFVYVRTEFVGFHRWKDAPDDMAFLRDFHRHVFKVRVMVKVDHANRAVEFFQLKRRVNNALMEFREKQFEFSCEQIAEKLLGWFDAEEVEVSEDGENGAVVRKPPLTYVEMVPQVEMDPEDEKRMKENLEQYSQGLKRFLSSQGMPPGTTAKAVMTGPSGEMMRKVDEKNKVEVHKIVRKKPFVGTEAEGPNRGTKVLFIPGSCDPETFEKAYRAVGTEVIGCYYGAGNDFKEFQPETLKRILYRFNPSVVTVESKKYRDDISRLIDSRVQWVMHEKPPTKDGRMNNVFLKTVSPDGIRWYDLSPNGINTYFTEYNDPLYDQDKEVEV